ncbi:MAG: hypothetical protein ACTHNP_01275 [Solirubrobacterales bacterium]
MRRGLPVLLLLPALLVLVASSASVAQAQVPLERLGPAATAWGQIVPLVRKETSTRKQGFDFRPTLRIKTASGYRVEATEIGGAIVVIIGRRKGTVTAYLGRGVATSRRLAADFGRFGKLDMRFRPSPHLAPLPPRHHCHGSIRHPKRRGVWVGGFRFSGEGDYVSVRVHRAGGSIRRETAVCAHAHFFVRRSATASSGPFSSFVPREELTAGWRRGTESADFSATTLLFHPIFFARSEQALGSVAIIRLAVAIQHSGSLAVTAQHSGSLVVNDALTHAEAAPPPPFHGVGVYTASPDGTKTWTGDLTVNFPGAPSFPLTGEAFEAEAQRPLSGAVGVGG